MAKAALNMLTRATATEMFDHGVLVTSADTDWITDERPHTTKQRLATEGFRAPLAVRHESTTLLSKTKTG
ncbi:hypothetical protein CIP107528_01266 [Corynebacterium diphtheriae]|nr:hypothetical protein FRC061569_01095 [Corynebacterium diphtheriae]CAB0511589.1 hypothetical protein FRC020338_01333 [Corynebacterium diphtheriae]CAB0553546.1 hypothetical protein CIP107522_01223 [Corynebacterium diphtheriae]CAB0554681.1 hypothetical protein CIP107528_01266 [Corynebacterium diphtheriae]